MFLKKRVPVVRMDGYNERAIRIVCDFQACIEREGGDMDALRAALLHVRDNRRPVQDFVLRAAYNDAIAKMELGIGRLG